MSQQHLLHEADLSAPPPLQFTYTASQPGTHQKIIDMAMNGVGCRATARIMGVGLNTILRHLKNSGRSR